MLVWNDLLIVRCGFGLLGMVDLCLPTPGDHLVTCGLDATIKRINITDHSAGEVASFDNELATVTANVDGTELFVGADDGLVQIFSYPGGEFKDNLIRLSVPPKHIAASKDHV